MFTVKVSKECGCFKKSDFENNAEYVDKDEALMQAQKMTKIMNDDFCQKHNLNELSFLLTSTLSGGFHSNWPVGESLISTFYLPEVLLSKCYIRKLLQTFLQMPKFEAERSANHSRLTDSQRTRINRNYRLQWSRT